METIKNNRNKIDELIPMLWCFAGAVLIMTICSRSSFLYVYNLWDDANSYFTMGKCIFRGFVPYRDLFDQKGIMLYFIYGFASLISATTFRGVYVMEIIAAYFSLLALFKIARLFLRRDLSAYLITPLAGAVIYSPKNFYWGGSAEEFLFPFVMWGLYISVKYFRTEYPKPMNYNSVLLGGIFAGCVLNIKFNSLGFFFAFMMMVFFADIIGERRIVEAFSSCFIFIGGMLFSTLPWIIYFGLNGAIGDWIYVYIYKNVFEYSKSITPSERGALFYDIIKNHALNNMAVFAVIFVGMVFFTASMIITLIVKNKASNGGKEKVAFIGKDRGFLPFVRLIELINLGMLLLFLVLVIFIGGVSLPYYSFPMNGFVIFGFIALFYPAEELVIRIMENRRSKAGKKSGISNTALYVFAAMVSLCVAAAVSLAASINVKTMSLTEDDLWLYRFRDYIVDSGIRDPGLIVEFTFDVGLYTVLDIEPICYYYQTQTLNMDEVLKYQKQYLHSGEADFVVTCDIKAEGTGDRYDLVMEERCVFYDFDRTYYLYQRNDTPAGE